MLYNAPCSAGDLVDRITILENKLTRFSGEKRELVFNELHHLQVCAGGLALRDGVYPHYLSLQTINARLWDIEDSVRDHIKRGDLGPSYIATAMQVPQLNDVRARLKRQINENVGSTIVEVKSHSDA